MKRYVCVHGHFYQPPRENPWLEVIEVQDSAYPFHDWNERINRECYAPNTASRLLDDGGRIKGIVNNFEKISFNVGPTLLSWLKAKDPVTYKKIIDADKASVTAYGGHGSAMAQSYNHIIMPLATERDKETQIVWGIADFKSRFGREPEGMWLSETAVDKKTLELLADNGILFTVLSQNQADATRMAGENNWHGLETPIDPARSYVQPLSDGKSISLFFYDGPISQAVAFERLLSDGEKFAERLKSGFSDKRDWPQLLHIATDGETFGHHHSFGEMALTYALSRFECCDETLLTNYGEYLALYPPVVEVDIHENSSWSCVHGVERWRSNCGCNVGTPGFNQEWRAPLREALDYLKSELDTVFEREGEQLFYDPWLARNRYIEVILDRSKTLGFLSANMKNGESNDKKIRAMKLLELQRNSMLMFTSCGWFFDDVSGIETVQILRYAARAIQLCADVTGNSLEEKFTSMLRGAKSNIPTCGTAEDLYRTSAMPEIASLEKILANHIISRTLIPGYTLGPRDPYIVEESDRVDNRHGDASLAISRARIFSSITLEEELVVMATLRLGATDVACYAMENGGGKPYESLVTEIVAAWEKHDVTEIMQVLEKHFKGQSYSLKNLFMESRRTALNTLFASHIKSFHDIYEDLFWKRKEMMGYFLESNVPAPLEFRMAAQYILEKELIATAAGIGSNGSAEKLGDLMAETKKWNVEVNLQPVRKALEARLWKRMEMVIKEKDPESAKLIVQVILAALTTGLDVDLWRIQNVFAEVYFGEKSMAGEEFLKHSNMKKLAILLNFTLRA